MGLAFLPWERLPAYVFGPLICGVSIWAMFSESSLWNWHSVLAACSAAFGAWVVWARYKTGEEPLWTEEQRAVARKRRERAE